MAFSGAPNFLRSRNGHQRARVTNIELFFDLVFVFAITQLSHSLLGNLTLDGAIHTLLLFLAVWWVWIYTSWVTNWLDPDRVPVRLLLLVLMVAGLVLSTSIPAAFEDKGLAFAIAFVIMQVGRSLFALWALGNHNVRHLRNFVRITSWLAVSGLFWLAGGLFADHRLAFWITALVIEYIAPSTGFWLPGLGRSTTDEWDVEGGHMAERCSLFVIIALGESVLVTGATFANLPWGWDSVAAFLVAFASSLAMWWIYFDKAAERGSEHITHSSDPGRLARLAYTYFHLFIIAGIVVGAVADELILAHPHGQLDPWVMTAVLGAPAIYLIGNLLFKTAIAGRPPLSHMVGLALLLLIGLVAPNLSSLGLGAAATMALVVTAIWETISLNRGPKPAA